MLYGNTTNTPPNYNNTSTGYPPISNGLPVNAPFNPIITSNPYNTVQQNFDSNFYLRYENLINMIITKDGKKHTVIENNELKLNETDSIDICEVLNVFEYMKKEYPGLYADLILKGIIK